MIHTSVWDLATRLFHSVLIILVGLSLYSAFQDKFDIWGQVHYWSGISVFGLVTWRIFWGFFGSETNRFIGSLKSPVAALKSLVEMLKGKASPSVGHGASGAWSVVIMLLLLFAQSGLGLFASDDMFFSGPLSSERDWLPFAPTSLHETLGFLLMGFLVVHILVVLTYQLWNKINIIGPMIHGKKALDDVSKAPYLRSWWVGLLTLVGIAAGLTLWIGGNGP